MSYELDLRRGISLSVSGPIATPQRTRSANIPAALQNRFDSFVHMARVPLRNVGQEYRACASFSIIWRLRPTIGVNVIELDTSRAQNPAHP